MAREKKESKQTDTQKAVKHKICERKIQKRKVRRQVRHQWGHEHFTLGYINGVLMIFTLSYPPAIATEAVEGIKPEPIPKPGNANETRHRARGKIAKRRPKLRHKSSRAISRNMQSCIHNY